MIRRTLSAALVLRAIAPLALAPCFALASFVQADDPKIQHKPHKGQAAEFTVKESSAMEGGQFQNQSETEIAYKVEVTEKRDNGDLVLKVTYASVKAKQDGREGSWEFDSSKKEGGDEIAAQIREGIAKSVTLDVTGGKITEISGIAEPSRPEQGGDRDSWRRYMRSSTILGKDTFQRHMEMILATAIQGQALEKGKEFRIERSKDRKDGDEKGREGRGRGFRGRSRVDASWKYDGEEKVGGAKAAKFTLIPHLQERAGGDRPEPQLKGEGTAYVSVDDGLLLKLALETETTREFERDGQTTKFLTKSKTNVERKGASAGGERTAVRF